VEFCEESEGRSVFFVSIEEVREKKFEKEEKNSTRG